jgi:hypothetical protein
VHGAFLPADGGAFAARYDRRTMASFVDFLTPVGGWVPAEATTVFAIMDNLAAHRGADALLFSARYPRWRFVSQPTYAPYLNLIEPWWRTLRSLVSEGPRKEGGNSSVSYLIPQLRMCCMSEPDRTLRSHEPNLHEIRPETDSVLSHWDGRKLVARTGFEPVISTLRGLRTSTAARNGVCPFPINSVLL